MRSNGLTVIPKKKFFALIVLGRDQSAHRLSHLTEQIEGQHQIAKCYQLVSKFCDKVFISATKEQAADESLAGFPVIYDINIFEGIGLMGHIISAMSQHPQADWLVVSADFPGLNDALLDDLIAKRNKRKLATTFRNSTDGYVETLCTIYDSKCGDYFLQLLKNNQPSLEHFLTEYDVEYIAPPEKSLLNVSSSELEKLRKAKSFITSNKPI
ncbi:MAG: NTP transferase domain-containing protein [Candidatus Omnitrophica bacterium]|nr:NTP transferase domain-containing protein [Candidatus Omnitrophota bacterium]MCB9748141.1 NTP transferase domain-containing protein [Candidatus Omnitrophota bacterium]